MQERRKQTEFDIHTQQKILQPQLLHLNNLAKSFGITSEWIDSLPPKISTIIKIAKPYAMEKILYDALSLSPAKEQIQRPHEDIRHALGAVKNTVGQLFSEVYMAGQVDGTELNYSRRPWKLMEKFKDQKIKKALDLTTKEGELEVIQFLLSTDKEHILYQMTEADKNRNHPNHP